MNITHPLFLPHYVTTQQTYASATSKIHDLSRIDGIHGPRYGRDAVPALLRGTRVAPFWPARKTDICQNDSGTSNENRAQATAQSSKLDFKAEPAWPSNPTLCAAIANGTICQITVSCVCRPDARTHFNALAYKSTRAMSHVRERCTICNPGRVDAPSASQLRASCLRRRDHDTRTRLLNTFARSVVRI